MCLNYRAQVQKKKNNTIILQCSFQFLSIHLGGMVCDANRMSKKSGGSSTRNMQCNIRVIHLEKAPTKVHWLKSRREGENKLHIS